MRVRGLTRAAESGRGHGRGPVARAGAPPPYVKRNYPLGISLDP